MSEVEVQGEWPEWLLESYGKLPLPSLHDYLLHQEKLAGEIRKQNKELRLHSDHLNHMRDNLDEVLTQLKGRADFQGNEEVLCEERDAADSVVQQMQHIVMGMMDALFNLLEATAHSNHALLDIIPEFTGFWKKSKPGWRTQAEHILEGGYTGVELIRNKALSALAASGITVIIPELGSPFDPSIQRAVEQVNGGDSRHIAKVVRYGYLRGDELIRYAEVAVYTGV